MMKYVISVFGALLAIVLSLGVAWAESGSRTGDAADFLLGTQCPPDNGPCFDANASGQKLQAQLAATYDKLPVPDFASCQLGTANPDACACRPAAFVKNMFVNLTVEQNNLRLPFTSEFVKGPPSHATPLTGFSQPGFCMFTQTLEQVKIMTTLVKNRVIPFFYNCDPDTAGSCPGFRIKAVTDFQYTTADPRAVPNPFAGGFSADISIAVQQ
jgi:hypothetical protein